jgi:octaprenyl-diphosphate synthase
VRTFLKRVVEDGEIGPGDLEQAAAYMRQHHAIEDTIDRARHFGAVARDALAPLDESGAKAALIEAVDFSISRVN